MAAVHFGRLLGPAAFARTVAVKHLHVSLAESRDAVETLIREAELAARLHHPNVVPTLDVVVDQDEAYAIMEYVHGESLARLLRAAEPGARTPAGIASAIISGTLRGLHAAHEALDESGEPLEIIHRDVSPQNILVGTDGVARLIDFGIAKARLHAPTTAEGNLKGKLSYLAPEQIRGARANRLTDIYSAGVVLWEALTGRRLFEGDSAGAITERILVGWVEPPSKYRPELTEALDDVVLRALETEPKRRFMTAEQMAGALEQAEPPAPQAEVGAWVTMTAGEALRRRAEALRSIEASERTPRPSPRTGSTWRAAAAVLAVGLPGIAAIAFYARSHAVAPSASHDESVAAPSPGREDTARPIHAPEWPNAAVGTTNVPPADPSAITNTERREKKSDSVGHSAGKSRGTTPTNSKDCDPPYSINPDGIRIYKRACFSVPQGSRESERASEKALAKDTSLE
jgi:serine/threonine-protein kinase